MKMEVEIQLTFMTTPENIVSIANVNLSISFSIPSKNTAFYYVPYWPHNKPSIFKQTQQTL